MPTLLRQILKTTKLSPLRIALIYALVAGLWIFLSGNLVSRYAVKLEDLYYFEQGKGVFFVFVTSILLYFLCRSWSRQIVTALKRHQDTQAQYETYIKSSPIPISIVNREGQILETNAANEELTGYGADALKAMTIFDLDRTEEEPTTARMFTEIFDQGKTSHDRLLRKKDGTFANLRVDGVRTGDRAIFFARDITDRIQNERKLLMLNSMLRAIRRVNKTIIEEYAPHALIKKICDILVEEREVRHAWIALMDGDGQAQHVYGAPGAEDSRKLSDFLHSGRLGDCFEHCSQSDGLILSKAPARDCPAYPILDGAEDGALLGMHFNYKEMTGYIILTTDRAAVDDRDEINLFREVVEDLKYALHTIQVEEDKTKVLEELIETKRSAEAANRAKDDFLAVMSHELRTPLNPIIGFSELLLEECTKEENKKHAEIILNAGNRQLKLIDDILHYMRLDRGSVTVEREAFNLVALCQSIVEECPLDDTSLQLKFENGRFGKPVSPDLKVVSDQLIIHRILSNFISNACKYTKEGEVILSLSESNKTAGSFILAVKDTGIGIHPETQSILFEAFSQADSSYSRRHEGIGLGLAICKKLVDLLEGTLCVDSTPGIGSTFCVQLPLTIQTTVHTPKASPPKPKLPKFERSLRILVADDKPDNLFVIQETIKRSGGETVRAANGSEAVELSQTETFDLILMDLAMPVMNGLEASRLIRAEGPNKNTPIIAITADAQPEVPQKCEAAGITATLFKPVRTAELIETILEHV